MLSFRKEEGDMIVTIFDTEVVCGDSFEGWDSVHLDTKVSNVLQISWVYMISVLSCSNENVV